MAGKDDLEKFEDSMRFITELKDEGKIRQIEMSMVIQDSNFREIPSFVRRCLDVYHADVVILRPIFKWFNITWDELLYKNVLNPCHPYHEEYLEIIKDPIPQDPRIRDWGYLDKQEPMEFPTLEMKEYFYGENGFFGKVKNAVYDIIPGLKEAMNKSGSKKIIIYGCGKVGKKVFEVLTCGDEVYDIAGFLVESSECNPSFWMGKEVKTLSDNSYDKNDIVLVALTKIKRYGVKDMLRKSGFENVIIIDEKSDEQLV